MKKMILRSILLACFAAIIASSCGRDSSPEGRMEMKLEKLQNEMLENQKRQNAAILDSLRSIREEIIKLQQRVK